MFQAFRTHATKLTAAIAMLLVILCVLLWLDGAGNEAKAQFHFPKAPNIPIPNIPGGNGGNRPANSNDLNNLVDLGQNALSVLDMDNPSRQEEVGQSIALAISNRYPLCKDQKLNEYVALVGLTVASVSPRPDLEYAFGVLETAEIGAYSAPGGYIFITRGAVNLMQDESELAGVLAHEIGHVVKNHGIEAVKAARMKVVADKAVTQYGNKFSQFSAYADTGTQFVLVTGYSQNQERDADSEAIKYLILAGYDPRGFVHFLGRMQQQSHDATGFHAAMSTHPGTAERIGNCTRQIASYVNVPGTTLKDRFEANVTKTAPPAYTPPAYTPPPVQAPPPAPAPKPPPSFIPPFLR